MCRSHGVFKVYFVLKTSEQGAVNCAMTTPLNPGTPSCLGPVSLCGEGCDSPERRRASELDRFMGLYLISCLFQRKLVKWVFSTHRGALWRADKNGDSVLSRTLNLEQTQQVSREKTDPSRGPSGN